MLPLVRGGLTQLCGGLEDGDHVFRREEGNRYGTTFGRNQLGSLFTKTFGHSCGVLRKAVEQRAEDLYRNGELSLDQCAEVHRRCQHKGDTALQKYVLRLQSMETDVPDDVSDAETLDLPPDAIDTSASDDEENTRRDNDSPPCTHATATQTESDETIESVQVEESFAAACIKLWKRARTDEDVALLEMALHAAKRTRGC
jgi:hypothetical protein